MSNHNELDTPPAGHDIDAIDYGNVSSQNLIDAAQGLECEIFYPSDAQLTLDLDNEKDFQYFMKQYSRWKYYFGFASYEILKSRHGNKHVIIALKNPITDIKERLLLQALLGSDRIREALSFLRIKRNDPHPSILLRPKITLENSPAQPRADGSIDKHKER